MELILSGLVVVGLGVLLFFGGIVVAGAAVFGVMWCFSRGSPIKHGADRVLWMGQEFERSARPGVVTPVGRPATRAPLAAFGGRVKRRAVA